LTQCGQQAINFLRGVVVRQSYAQKTAILFHVGALGKIERVVIAVTGKDATLTQPGGELQRSVALDAHAKRGTTPVKPCRINDAIKFESRNSQQSADKNLHQTAL